MPDLLLRGLPEKTHHELKRRAKAHGRSVNAEIVAVLDEAAKPQTMAGMLADLDAFKKKLWGDEVDVTFEVERDRTPARFVDFSGPEFDLPEER